MENGDFDELVSPDYFPTEFARAHPTVEHYVPLIVTWAAAGKHHPGKRIHHSFSYGNLDMSCFEFGNQS